MATSSVVVKTTVLYLLVALSSAQNFDINEYLDNWYYDRENRHIILREGESEHADMNRKCPPKLYFSNRLLCYTYWKNIIAGDTTFWGKIPDGRQRGMLESLDKEKHHGSGIKPYQELLSNSQMSGIISKSDGSENQQRGSRGLIKAALRANIGGRNNRVVLFHG